MTDWNHKREQFLDHLDLPNYSPDGHYNPPYSDDGQHESEVTLLELWHDSKDRNFIIHAWDGGYAVWFNDEKVGEVGDLDGAVAMVENTAK